MSRQYSSFTEEDRLFQEEEEDEYDIDDDDAEEEQEEQEQGLHRIITTPCRPRFWKTTFGSVLFMTLILIIFPGRLIWIAQLLLMNRHSTVTTTTTQPHRHLYSHHGHESSLRHASPP
jgi:hypothetical protein